jgi:hypothetical protein
MKGMQMPAFSVGFALVVGAAALAEPKPVEKPGFFQTLVNPPCSYCIDESKRRPGELREDDRVLAWIRGKHDGGAVPFRFFLVPYRVISDTYGVWVYDADAGFVRGYEPSLDFSFYGWRNGIMVIQHKDGTLFSALSGRAFDGPRKGSALKPLPTVETDWGYWLKQYPKTVAYHMFEKYAAHELPTQGNADSISSRGQADKRLGAEEMVVGMAAGNKAKAYPLSQLAARRVIRDKVGEQELVALWYEPTKTAAVFALSMEDETVPERLRLEHNPQIPTAPFMDKETFSHWTIEGRSVAGPLKGKTLRWLPGVQCKWFAWAAEYPDSEIYSPKEKRAEAVGPMVAKLIQGERLDWDKLTKTTGYVVKKDRAGKSVTVFADADKEAHELALTPHTEFFVQGAWGELTDFAVNESVYLIATQDEHKKLVAVHALADDVSMQAMSRPYVIQSRDKSKGLLIVTQDTSSKAPLTLRVNRKTKFSTRQGEDLQVGRAVYCNRVHTAAGWLARELLDESSFEARRNERLAAQRKELAKNGLSGSILEVDRARHQVIVMLRRSDSWYGRLLQIGDAVRLRTKKTEETACKVGEVRPDYSRVRLRLDFAEAALPQLERGGATAVFALLPEKADLEMPPDLGRFTEEQARIDYLLSTLYCPCGMIGDSCAGHWNTLAACKLHGCGMPNLVSKQIGDWIEAGKSDAAIVAELVERNGRDMLRIHQDR